eukprot:461518_1
MKFNHNILIVYYLHIICTSFGNICIVVKFKKKPCINEPTIETANTPSNTPTNVQIFILHQITPTIELTHKEHDAKSPLLYQRLNLDTPTQLPTNIQNNIATNMSQILHKLDIYTITGNCKYISSISPTDVQCESPALCEAIGYDDSPLKHMVCSLISAMLRLKCIIISCVFAFI